MEILKYIAVYGTAFITILILDYIWLGIVTKEFIIKEFGNLVTVKDGSIVVNLKAGIPAWFAISAMVVTFVTLKYEGYATIIFYGALLGFFSYCLYDLTNLTFINGYSLKFSLVDIAWGTFLCSMIALSSYSVLQFFNK